LKRSIGIVFGGNSVEHEISILSFIQALHAIDTEKYAVLPIYLTKTGEFWVGPNFNSLKTFQKDNFRHYRITFQKRNEELHVKGIGFLPRKYRKKLDAILPIVHGKNVEDGSLAGFFKIYNVAYAGSDIFPAALFQDKFFAKKMLAADGIPVLPCRLHTYSEYKSRREEILEAAEKEGYPVIVKPATLGSSIGIKVANDAEELVLALNYAFKYEDSVLIERKLASFREFNQAVLEKNGDYLLSTIEEVKSENPFLTFTDKYMPINSKHEIPAQIPETLRGEISRISLEIAKKYGMRGVIRIDYLFDAEEMKLYVNEVNTIPGSLAYYLFEEQMSFTELIDTMLSSAFKAKHRSDLKLNSFPSMVLSSGKSLKK